MAKLISGMLLLAIVLETERPREKTYEARYLPEARITIDGRLDDPAWDKANVERGFAFPWKETAAPLTEFRGLCDAKAFYFSFRVHDEDIVVEEAFQEETDAIGEDRVEVLFALDEKLAKYFCMEIDSRGRYLDFKASYYRKFDFAWDFPGLRTAASPWKQGYLVEGLIHLKTLEALGFPPLGSGRKIKFGVFRAEFSHGKGPKPIENWISWVDPQTKEPDFHVPGAFGRLRVVK